MSVVGPVTAIATESKDDPVRAAMEDLQVHAKLKAQAYILLYGNSADVDDALQEVFHRVLKDCTKYDASRRSVTGWIAGYMANVCREFLREKGKLGKHQVKAAQSQMVQDLDEAELAEECALVHRYLALLPPDFRTVLQLRFIQGLELQEIAEQMKITYANARQKISRARKALKELAAGLKEARL